jgi:streptogramin lyase
MRGLAPKLVVVAAIAALAASAAPALAAPHVDGVFKVSATGANNLKMVEGPDGNVWMTLEGSLTNDVAKLSPAGVVTEYKFEAVAKPPSGIAVGPEKAMWVTVEGGVAKFSTADPTKAVETPIAGIAANSSIVAGPNGEMWVATTNAVFHFSPSNPAGAKEIPVTELTPHDIDVAGQLLVISDANKGRIVTVTTAGGLKDVAFVNNPTGTSQGVAGSPGGQFAFAESDGKEGLGLDTPPNPATAELRNVGDPFGVALGSDGAYYFAMSGDEDVRRLVPGVPSTAITGFPKEFRPRQVTAGAGNTIWVAIESVMPGEDEVVRISGLEPPVKSSPSPSPSPTPPGPGPVVLPQTVLGKKPKKVVEATGATAKVRFAFSSSAAGASFECSLGRRVKPKGKKPRFVGQAFAKCGSPKTYRLKPGSYRFQVRAVAGSLRDSSPAKFSFKVIHAAR